MKNKDTQLLEEAYGDIQQNAMTKKVTVTLELSVAAVKKIERLAEQNIKELLENEINNSTDTFIEMMGYDNY
jgi:hypothetical protein